MITFFKKIFILDTNNTNKNNEDIYYENIKEASNIFDNIILTISSVFLGFLFSQIQNYVKLDINIFNHEYIIFSIILIGISIALILLSYYFTIIGANLGEKIKEGKLIKNIWYNIFDLINFLRLIYFISFIVAIIFTTIFYITNLNNYVG